jgi:hypothetical protein
MGVLDDCPTYFYHLIIMLFFSIYILNPPYINYNPLIQIITYPILLLNLLFE